MAEPEVLPQKIADTREIILKPRLDPNKVRLQGEKSKTSFFDNNRFSKPKSEDILLVAFNKYYEPYIVIGGKYSVDYCKKHNFALKVEDKIQEIFIDGKKLIPEPVAPGTSVVKLAGEEHAHYENETYLVLDRTLREVPTEKLVFAPFESALEAQLKVEYDLRKPKFSIEEEIALLRSRVAKRPCNAAEIIRENFEITDRMIVYYPIYELTFQNVKNGQTVTALINSVSGEVLLGKFEAKVFKNLGDEEIEVSSKKRKKQIDTTMEVSRENPQEIAQFFREEPKQQPLDDAYVVVPAFDNQGKSQSATVMRVGGESTPQPEPYEANDEPQSTVEGAARAAVDFMKRLGYTEGQFPTKVYVEGENEIVELKLPRGTARVQIDSKTKEVKEYEVQEGEIQSESFMGKRKLLFLLPLVAAIVAALKLLNIF
ncbi:MAG: hypothetical protein NWF09_04110 [Candidatus Bathyarchaeota archaeon]|nr:hypothetical protein [Candidatus Bathyarchaeota archaeon]